MGIFVVFLLSSCRVWWPAGNGRGKWEWKRWKGEEKSGHCLRASFSMHSPGRGWCWQHNSRMTWQLMGEKRGRMEMCLWEGFVCQWALAWTNWKSLSFSLSHSHSFHFQLSLTLSLLWPIWCQGTWGCCHSKSLSSKALYSRDSKLCPPVWLSECMCVRMRVYSAFLLSCTQFCVCQCLSGFGVL